MPGLRCWLVAALTLVALVAARDAVAGPPTDQLRGAVDRVVQLLERLESWRSPPSLGRRFEWLPWDAAARERSQATRAIIGPPWQ
jgi:hypothetical protein